MCYVYNVVTGKMYNIKLTGHYLLMIAVKCKDIIAFIQAPRYKATFFYHVATVPQWAKASSL